MTETPVSIPYGLVRSSRAVWLSASIPLTLVVVWLAQVFDSGDASEWPTALLLICTPALLILLVVNGRRWARWLLIVLYTGLGFATFFIGVSESMLSGGFTSPDFWLSGGLGLWLMGSGMALFISEKLDQFLAQVAQIRGRGPSWDDVAVSNQPETSRLSSPPYDPDPIAEQRLKRLGRLAPLAARIAAIAGWLAVLAAAYLVWIVFLQFAAGVQDANQFNEAVDLAAGTQPPLVGAVTRFSFSLLITLFVVFTVALLPAAFLLVLVGGYLVQVLVPFFLTLPFTLPVVIGWRTPARILVLRPFNRGRITTALRKALRREVATLGHCYTLADSHIRVPLRVRIPLVLGQLSLFTFRQRKIVQPAQIEKLVRAMGRRVRRNFNWCLSWDKLFPVACIDSGWQACVARLVAEVDVVVMDLTGVSEHILWELALLARTDAINRTVFVVEESGADQAQVALRETPGAEGAPAALILYGSAGECDPRRLHEAVRGILRPQ